MSLRSFVAELVWGIGGAQSKGGGKLILLPPRCSTKIVVEILTPRLEEDQIA